MQDQSQWLNNVPSISETLPEKKPLQLQAQTTSKLKIAPLSVKHFAGDIRQFPQFKDAFDSLIKPLCAPNQLALALKNHLSDEVRAAVDSIGNDFEKIWKRLELRYGNTRKLVDAILQDIKNMQGDGDEVGDALEMIDVVEKAHLDLETIGEEHELYNTTMISLIEDRMSVEMKSEWVKKVAGRQRIKGPEKFKELLQFLEEWRYRLEYLNDSRRMFNSNTLYTRGEHNTGTKNQHQCWIHKESGNHPIWRCRTFRDNKTVEERIQLTLDNNACLACLEVGHNSENCPKNFRCKINNCNGTHNELLHQTDNGANGPPNIVLPKQ